MKCKCGKEMEPIDVGEGVGELHHCPFCGRLYSIGEEGQAGWIEHTQVLPVFGYKKKKPTPKAKGRRR